MKDRETGKRLLILLISAIGMLAMVGFYAWIWFGFYYPKILIYDIKLYFNGHILILLIYTVILFLFSNLYGGLKIGYLKPMEVFLSQVFSLICVNVMSYFQLALIHGNLIWPVPFFRMMAGQLVFSAVWIYFANLVYRRIFPPRKLLLIHGDRSIEDILHKFASRKDKYNIVKCMGLEEGAEALFDEMEKGYGGVVLWDIPTAVRNKLLKYCYSRSIRIYLMPKIPDVIIKGSEQLHLFDTPILLTRESALTVEQRIIKRCIDIVCLLPPSSSSCTMGGRCCISRSAVPGAEKSLPFSNSAACGWMRKRMGSQGLRPRMIPALRQSAGSSGRCASTSFLSSSTS